MPISKFDEEIQKAIGSFVRNDFDAAKMQLGAMESRIKKDFIKSKNMSKLLEIKRVRFIQAGLFNKKIKL